MRYSCSGEVHGGPCPTGRYDGYVHQWKRNPPVFDEGTNEIHGPVTWVNAIDDWPGGPAPAPGSPTYRIGKLDWLQLSSGRMVKFENAGLWRDSSGTSLFILAENPTTSFHGIPLVSAERLKEVRGSRDIVAVLFVGSECHSCAKLKPELVRLARRFAGTVAFDVDRPGHVEPALAEGVRATPSLILYRKGSVVGRVTKIKDVLARLEMCEAATLRALSDTRRAPTEV